MINIPEKNINRRGIFNKTVVKEPEQPKQKKRRFTFHFKIKKFSFKKKESLFKISRNKKRWIITALAALVIIAGGTGYGIYEYLYQNDPRVIFEKKLKTLTQAVSQQVKLPTDETPVTATVTDVSKLPNELFFKYAHDGDKILMYKKHKLVILYRPSTGQVITEGTLEFKDIIPTPMPEAAAVAGASTSALPPVQNTPSAPAPTVPYIPQGKVLIQPQQ
jgi:hypothetical protein